MGPNATAASVVIFPSGVSTNADETSALQLTFLHPLGGYGPDPISGGIFGPSFECANSFSCQFNPGPDNARLGDVRYVTGGIAAGVPEVSTWEILLLGGAT